MKTMKVKDINLAWLLKWVSDCLTSINVQFGKQLERKYPNAGKDRGWFWTFPAPLLSVALSAHWINIHLKWRENQ
jgi:hypothetical protein